jgi:RhoGEF domain
LKGTVSNNQSIGNLFITLTDSLECYKTYLNNYDVASSLVNWAQKSHQSDIFKFPATDSGKYSAININMPASTAKKLTSFIAGCKKDPKHTQLNLLSYLLMPVQRIPRYKMLLESLLKHTPVSHEDYLPLYQATTMITEFVDSCNEAKRAWEKELGRLYILKTVIPTKQSINAEIITSPQPWRKFLESSKKQDFTILKFVEIVPKLKPTLLAKRSQIIKTTFSCTEYRFNPCDLLMSAGENLVPAYSRWDISRTLGTKVLLLLFNDMMLVCNEQQLVACMSISNRTNAETLLLKADEGVMRVCDGSTVIYIGGQINELQCWVTMIETCIRNY